MIQSISYCITASPGRRMENIKVSAVKDLKRAVKFDLASTIEEIKRYGRLH